LCEVAERLHLRVKQVFLPLGLIASDKHKQELIKRVTVAYELLKSIDGRFVLAE